MPIADDPAEDPFSRRARKVLTDRSEGLVIRESKGLFRVHAEFPGQPHPDA